VVGLIPSEDGGLDVAEDDLTFTGYVFRPDFELADDQERPGPVSRLFGRRKGAAS
jgi:hypothetical protein